MTLLIFDFFGRARSILEDLGLSIVRRVGTTPFWFVGETPGATSRQVRLFSRPQRSEFAIRLVELV
jgi:hypothetical protein